MLSEYIGTLLFIVIGFGVGIALMAIPIFIGKFLPNKEKLSAYECGIEPLGNARNAFEVHFYLIAMMFVIFDLEIALLLPWALNVSAVGAAGFITASAVIAILGIGIVYEWRKGVINW